LTGNLASSLDDAHSSLKGGTIVFLILALIILVLAVGGGLALHPLLFLLLVIAAIFAVSHVRHSPAH
jgi:hypothetical protein